MTIASCFTLQFHNKSHINILQSILGYMPNVHVLFYQVIVVVLVIPLTTSDCIIFIFDNYKCRVKVVQDQYMNMYRFYFKVLWHFILKKFPQNMVRCTKHGKFPKNMLWCTKHGKLRNKINCFTPNDDLTVVDNLVWLGVGGLTVPNNWFQLNQVN